ncbi:unnamed protein product [Microthlaspi erraticum]|uniref:F-box domain-containing protein n=1 Tax=Microthlaspi erraticum TaxID=1685480 RepID=A0A6D2J1S4_9BRAS|nr:unnamed protein product [Microthlaspi erraticum]
MMLTDWTQLPEELLQVITEKLENCFDVVHARSVCSSWRSALPFPCCLLSPIYSLPTFNKDTLENKGLWTLKKIPVFLFRVRTLAPAASASEYFMGGIVQDESENQTELPPRPLQCSVKLKFGESFPTLTNKNVNMLIEGHVGRATCRVSRLDEEAGKWVEATDLGDRVCFIGCLGSFSCSGKELPDGCGVSKNSVLQTQWQGSVFSYKYGRAENGLNRWDLSRVNNVKILNRYPVVALRFEHALIDKP